MMEGFKDPKYARTRTPFDNIALAFSGGGFRAASYSLGVLSYLHTLRLPDETTLLEKVTFISSSSGGTIASGMYALNSAQGKDFGEFYKKVSENLEGTQLLDNVFKKLNSNQEWEQRPDKRRNIINAFAMAYDENLFEEQLLEDLYQVNSKTHLEEVCFNTTEFYRGLLFRQNIKMQRDTYYYNDNQFRYGNVIINLKQHVAGKLKLSDLLAASSCFPAGFEPIIFPDDFTYNTSKDSTSAPKELNARTLLDNVYIGLQEVSTRELELLYGKEVVDEITKTLPVPFELDELLIQLRNKKLRDGFKFGMMDGGITDNQALESMLDANERRINRKTHFKQFDLMLINDVGSHYMDPYALPKTNKPYLGIQGITIQTIILLLSISSVVGAALLTYGLLPAPYTFDLTAKLFTIFGTSLLLTSSVLLSGIFFIRTYVKGNIHRIGGLDLEKNFSIPVVDSMFNHFGNTPVMVLIRMIRERISSVLLLNNDVFLKRIRFLLYHNLYENGRYRFRVKSNHVFDLAFSNDLNRRRNGIAELKPSRPIQIVAQVAFEMATTLWFDVTKQQGQTQAALIACGQFTTCYNLQEYILRLKTTRRKDGSTHYASLSPEYQEKVDQLEQQLKRDYAKFSEDPFWLYNRSGKEFGLRNFAVCSMEKFPFPTGTFSGLR